MIARIKHALTCSRHRKAMCFEIMYWILTIVSCFVVVAVPIMVVWLSLKTIIFIFYMLTSSTARLLFLGGLIYIFYRGYCQMSKMFWESDFLKPTKELREIGAIEFIRKQAYEFGLENS